MTQETAAFLAMRALLAADTRAEKSNARKMAEAVLAGRGFVLWRGSPESRTPGYIFGAFADRATCERAMRSTVWAATEEARGRDLAEACKIHGFEIVEVQPAERPPAFVWIVEGEHWEVSGIRQTAHTTEAGANAKAAELVNMLISDAVGPGRSEALLGVEFETQLDQATPQNWREVNAAFRKEMGHIDLGAREFEPTDEPPFGVTVRQIPMRA